MAHRGGVGDRILRRAADEVDDGGGGCHGETAEPRGFGDGTVAEIGSGVRD